MNTLFLITARGGSKGIPGKNIRALCGKPLIHYSIDVARHFVADDCICVSSDSDEIIDCVESYGLKVPFKRPAHLASDAAGSREVILHAAEFYSGMGQTIKKIVLLQPTSPFRMKKHVEECLRIAENSEETVVSVKRTKINPYQVLFMENERGFIEPVLPGQPSTFRRQDAPTVYQLNGAVYIYDVSCLLRGTEVNMKHYEMPEVNSVDIDEPLDWQWAEFLLEKAIIKLD